MVLIKTERHNKFDTQLKDNKLMLSDDSIPFKVVLAGVTLKSGHRIRHSTHTRFNWLEMMLNTSKKCVNLVECHFFIKV